MYGNTAYRALTAQDRHRVLHYQTQQSQAIDKTHVGRSSDIFGTDPTRMYRLLRHIGLINLRHLQAGSLHYVTDQIQLYRNLREESCWLDNPPNMQQTVVQFFGWYIGSTLCFPQHGRNCLVKHGPKFWFLWILLDDTRCLIKGFALIFWRTKILGILLNDFMQGRGREWF